MCNSRPDTQKLLFPPIYKKLQSSPNAIKTPASKEDIKRHNKGKTKGTSKLSNPAVGTSTLNKSNAGLQIPTK